MKLIIDNSGKLVRDDNKKISVKDINKEIANGNKSILEKITNIYTGIYDYDVKKPPWLVNNFHDEIWQLYFDNGNEPFKRTISWNDVTLSDGYKLTDNKHRELLNIFKLWVTLIDHPLYNRTPYHQLKHTVLWRNIIKTISTINGIIMYGDSINLCNEHLKNANEDFFLALMIKFASQGGVKGFYNLNEELTRLFIRVSKEVSDNEVRDFIIKFPSLESELEDEDKNLNITHEQRIKGCYWLYKNECLVNKKGTNSHLSMYLTAKLALQGKVIDIYQGSFQVINELRLSNKNFNSEYSSIYNNDCMEVLDHVTEFHVQSHIQRLRILGLVKIKKGKQAVNSDAFKNVTYQNISKYVVLKKLGRTKTLPPIIVLNLIRKSYDFCHDFQECILDAIINTIENVNIKNYSNYKDFKTSLNEETNRKLDELGVTTLSLKKVDYHAIRKNKGLFNLYDILLGSVQILVGAIMARRQSELVSLKPTKNLHPNIDPASDQGLEAKFSLIFHSKKTGSGGKITRNEKIKRPIPRSIALLVWRLEKFNEKIIEKKLYDGKIVLFNRLKHQTRKVTRVNSRDYNEALDRACDYFETPTVVSNSGIKKRYYIRQHQLRRFFALVFFYSKSYDGLDTLRWMLGHSDLEMLYKYLTESNKGGTLKGVKASYLVDAIKKDKLENIDKLRNLISKRYGVNFSSIGLSKTSDLINYYDDDMTIPSIEELKKSHNMETIILELLDEDIVKFEPEFFKIERNGDIVNDFHLTLQVKEDIHNET